ncbi:hypothetical protein M2169_004804 [Streptomyces sp. MJP52]|nr:hypothetical protein [Streptomyces sp. MJP52]
MPLLVFMNEQSCATEATPDEVAEGMRQFVSMLRRLRKWRDISLATQSPIGDTELAKGYYYAQWRNDRRNRDQHQFIQLMRDRCTTFAKALHDEASPETSEISHSHEGLEVQGLGAAQMSEGLALSLPVDTRWDAAWIRLDVDEITDDGSGELSHHTYTDCVRHACRMNHLEQHEKWARTDGLDAVSSGAELWARAGDLFPDLQFLPHVQDHLENLDPKWFKGAKRLLRQLQETAAGWDPVTQPTGPHWEAAHIRPEYEGARQNRWWDDLDGVSRCFELHGNLNRGAGRIYFRLVHEEKAIRIAHIGRHL